VLLARSAGCGGDERDDDDDDAKAHVRGRRGVIQADCHHKAKKALKMWREGVCYYLKFKVTLPVVFFILKFKQKAPCCPAGCHVKTLLHVTRVPCQLWL
jgi:hypothetical protein